MSRISFAMSGPTASDTMLMHANTAGSTGATFCFLQHQQHVASLQSPLRVPNSFLQHFDTVGWVAVCEKPLALISSEALFRNRWRKEVPGED